MKNLKTILLVSTITIIFLFIGADFAVAADDSSATITIENVSDTSARTLEVVINEVRSTTVVPSPATAEAQIDAIAGMLDTMNCSFKMG